MGPASKGGIDHKPGTKDFTEDWRHECQTQTLTYILEVYNISIKINSKEEGKRSSFCASK